MSTTVSSAAKRYAKFVPIAAAMACAGFSATFLVAVLTRNDAGSVWQFVGLAAALSFIAPLTLAGYWYESLPVILLLGLVLTLAWPRLGARVTGWRPHTRWQYVLVGMVIVYGVGSVLLLAFFTLIAIPSTLAGS